MKSINIKHKANLSKITNFCTPRTDYKFSICTPCFNSSDSIENVFRSLTNLEYQNFQWIVVNDASIDNTSEIIKSLMKEANFDIIFFDLTQNMMATYCYYLAIENASGNFLIFLDHDDLIKPNALNRFLSHWEKLSTNQKNTLAGMMSNCEDAYGDIVGTEFPASPYVNNFFDLMFTDDVRGEKFFCYKTNLMQEYNFQLIDRYVPESYIMWGIASQFDTLYFNESLRIYNQPIAEGKNLSLLNPFDYSAGFRLNYQNLINKFASKLKYRPYMLLNFLYKYAQFSSVSKVGFQSCAGGLENFFHRALIFPMYIFAKISFLKPRIQKKF